MISESILEGERVRLRPVNEDDLPRFVEWLADPEVSRWLAAVGEPPTLDDEHEWYEEQRANPDGVLWSIETLAGKLVGNTDLRLAPHADRAELGIAIQDKTRWSQGLGTDAVRLIVEYAFSELGLHRIELQVDEENERAIRCYEKCGFVREGLLRDHRRIDDRYSNTIQMAILAHEWKAR
ncbi:MAG: GNAT family N-acetyltransferase [Chloroflexi bacterium]|nr:GNAT family N-acetyltransferase [Chloroflexota bacterium]